MGGYLSLYSMGEAILNGEGCWVGPLVRVAGMNPLENARFSLF